MREFEIPLQSGSCLNVQYPRYDIIRTMLRSKIQIQVVIPVLNNMIGPLT